MPPNLSHLYETTPLWLDVSFVGITALTAGMLYVTVRQASGGVAAAVLLASFVWLTSLAVLANNHFFQYLDARPPRFNLVIGPPLVVIVGLLVTAKGRSWIAPLPLPMLTLLHAIRIPVELTLYGLYINHQIPQLMTFAGQNGDILAGLTAPVVAYFAFWRNQLSARWLLIWNGLALGLLINIVAHAILSAPFPFQQLAFSQPNVGILKAPYIWLPGFIVPVALFCHAVTIQRLIRPRSSPEPNQTRALRSLRFP